MCTTGSATRDSSAQASVSLLSPPDLATCPISIAPSVADLACPHRSCVKRRERNGRWMEIIVMAPAPAGSWHGSRPIMNLASTRQQRTLCTNGPERPADNRPGTSQFTEPLAPVARLLAEQKTDYDTLYALHAPEVECLAKEQAHG